MKWEYDITHHGTDESSDQVGYEVGEMGAQGWEAVGMLPGMWGDGFRVLYKRPAVEAPASEDRPHG